MPLHYTLACFPFLLLARFGKSHATNLQMGVTRVQSLNTLEGQLARGSEEGVATQLTSKWNLRKPNPLWLLDLMRLQIETGE